MKEFFVQHLTLIIGVIFVGVFVFQAARALKKAKKIDSYGIETDAVVSRISETWDPETTSSTYTTYVQFRDRDGILRECPVSLADKAEHSDGEKIRIRYIPGDYELVREAK